MQTYSKKQAQEHISRLVESFKKVEANLAEAQESQIENDYIRPLFRCLNWATEGSGLCKSEREMVLVETDRQGKRPDYRFQLNGQHLFFVDAKKVKYRMHDPHWQWQVYRYAYSTRHNPEPRKVDFSVLTDFQEFILLDCTFEAKEPEAVNNFRVVDWRYPDYVTQFDRLWELFERNNMLEASRDRKSGLWACYLSPKQAKANRVAPDEGFLDKLDNDKNGWRVRLAKDMKKRSPDLTGEVITGAVQLLIDRLVFIKALSDRDIDDDYLAKLAECIEADGLDQSSQGWFTAAKPLFDRLNRFYNGSMFAHRPELETVVTSNRVVRDIIRELDPDHSPYDLGVLPVEILGTIYERFLGKVVRTTEQRVKIEDKPEVRKAGGVYYTPQYIVRYIVEQTVGKLLADCKTPEDVAKLKVLDPACGSGSFLIGAYDALIEWHKSYYAAKAKPDRKAAYCDADGDIRLAAKLKRHILLNNIFGVDIDQQAVEVTRFSLSLKALEDTRKDELDEERNLFKETVLPDLKDNIVCGNSLIGTDILDGQLFASEEERKLNPLNYKDKFPETIRRGGFDAVIGNPPYIQLSMKEFRNEKANNYLRDCYQFSGGRLNTFAFFIERARQITREGGHFAYIVPNTLLTQEYYEELRQKLIQNTDINALAEPDGQIFKDAVVETVVLVLTKHTRGTGEIPEAVVLICKLNEQGAFINSFQVAQQEFARNYRSSFIAPQNPALRDLRAKIESQPLHFGEALNINQAIALKHDRAACLSTRKKTAAHNEILDGRHIGRYFTGKSPNYFRFDLKMIHSCKRDDIFLLPEKLFFRRVGDSLIATIDTSKKYALNTLVVVSPKPSCHHNLRFVLALLNSRLINFYYVHFLKSSKKVFSEIQARQVEQLPFPSLELTSPADKTRHDRVVDLVNQMLTAKKTWAAAQTEKGKTYYDDKCKALDKQIDALVYELYGLTAEEIKIVEGAC